MKRIFLFFILGLLTCSYVSGQSFKEDVAKALNAKNMIKAESILKAWDLADANDPELYVSYFNFFTLKSQEKDANNPDKEFVKKALEFIAEGVERFPTRFDMRIAEIYMLAKIKDFETLTSKVINMIDYSKKIENNWKGEDFRLVGSPFEMLEGSVLDFQGRLYAEDNPALYQNIVRISETMLKHYPKHVQSMLNLSTVYISEKKYDKSIDILKKATEIEPSNAILLYNLGYVYGVKEDKGNARKYFELSVANCTPKEAELKEAAQKQLEQIK
ncbi:MAG: tetratricopeptide repeat protein [Tannerella sp.]|jgi:tetratricopeptide (TPR) repeat protein|nr:tetratricopeptide repeat protein [Tannerella sp.]